MLTHINVEIAPLKLILYMLGAIGIAMVIGVVKQRVRVAEKTIAINS